MKETSSSEIKVIPRVDWSKSSSSNNFRLVSKESLPGVPSGRKRRDSVVLVTFIILLRKSKSGRK
jgi:hypothetical protein